MANPEHLAILAKGVEAWNAWRREHPEVGFIKRVHLVEADLRHLRLVGANLSFANLTSANLTGAYLPKADLTGAMLSRAKMITTILCGANLCKANLSDAELEHVDLQSSDLTEATLLSAKVKNGKLMGASFVKGNLRWADLHGADLSGADLRSSDLSRVHFTDANLRGANLYGATLRSATLTRARFGETVLSDLDLADAVGLDTIEHAAPSTIGLDTIYRSKGQIPESFLRGCGVPENFIAYMKSLTGAAFDFYSCFISYSTKDQPFADRLYVDLQARGIRCWFAPHDIQGGKKIHEQIDEAIRVYDKLLLILSDASMNSNWVKTEIGNARTREVQHKRQMLFPITLVPFDRVRGWRCFDADTGIDSAREIREYYVPDFSDWKDHDSYTSAFERLVGDLKTGAGTPSP